MESQEPKFAAEELAHDLRNVFQTILQAADLIAMDAQHAGVAGIIARSVEQGRRILNGAAEAEQMAPLLTTVDAAVRFVRDYAEMTRGPELRFHVDVPASLGLHARAIALERSLINLFANASDAARRAGRTEIGVWVTAQTNEGQVVVDVRDDGPGIAKEDLPFIFEPGYSAVPERQGLGLHIVRTAVEAEGGTVTAANVETGGAVFRILLPRAVRTSSAALGAEPMARP